MPWVDAVGWLGAIALLVSRWHVNVVRSRLLYVAALALLLAHTAALRLWPLAFAAAGMLAHGGWRLRRVLREDAADARFQVLEVGPQDEYLRHLLRVHGKDILQFQPGFVWDGAAADSHAAMVQQGAETVGLVLFRDAEPGVAQLELDYVTKPHRNLAPGRFLFFDSGFFADRGYRRVMTPPQMRAAYYDRLGFRSQDGFFVHDIAEPRR